MEQERLDALKARINIWESQIERMERKVKATSEDAKAKYCENLAYLRTQRNEAMRRYERMEEASKNSYEAMRLGILQAWESIKSGVRSASPRISDKDAAR